MKEYPIVTIYGNVPQKSNTYRIGVNGLYKTDKLKAYEHNFYLQVGSYRELNIDGFFEFYVDVYFPSMRSDLDNAMKVLLDCLQMTKTIKNDNRCVKIVARKFVDKTNPRVEIHLIEVD